MRVTVVCAPQTFGCNAGMYSVDLAAWYLLTKHFPDAQVTYATLYPHQCDFGEIPFRYTSQHGDLEVLRESDVILYWGDFLHALHYRNAVVSQLTLQGICSSPEQALALVRSYLFLADMGSRLQRKAILYGGTLLFNQPDCYLDELYANDLKRLVGSVRRVWMREPFSAFAVSQLQGQVRGCPQGTDCAQLLGRDFISPHQKGPDRPQEARNNRLGVFFGRSQLKAEQIAPFVSAIGADMHLDLSWLDWGRPPFFLDRRKEFLKLLPQAGNCDDHDSPSTPLQSLATLQRFDVLVSDTYHVCVNAWSFGIPAVCVIDNSDRTLPVNRGSNTSGRDKRVVFYWTYNAAPLLVYSSELGSEAALRKKATEIVSFLRNSLMIKQIQLQMSMHARVSEELLVQAIRS